MNCLNPQFCSHLNKVCVLLVQVKGKRKKAVAHDVAPSSKRILRKWHNQSPERHTMNRGYVLNLVESVLLCCGSGG